MKFYHRLIKVLSIILMLIVAIFGLITACSNSLRDTIVNYDIKETIVSPDGKYVAYAYICDAGATTDYSPQVTIALNGEKLSSANAGNVFVGYHGEYIHVEWNDARTLAVYYSASEVKQQNDQIWDMKIKY